MRCGRKLRNTSSGNEEVDQKVFFTDRTRKVGEESKSEVTATHLLEPFCCRARLLFCPHPRIQTGDRPNGAPRALSVPPEVLMRRFLPKKCAYCDRFGDEELYLHVNFVVWSSTRVPFLPGVCAPPFAILEQYREFVTSLFLPPYPDSSRESTSASSTT